jgi:hypothetical protein
MIVRYNPHGKPDAEDWLAMDDGEKSILVQIYHESKGIEIEGMQLHCLLHVVIENQLAMKIPEVVAAYRKLRQKNVTRHNALHALMNIMGEFFFEIRKGVKMDQDANKEYFKRLKKIRASQWKP